MDSSCQHPLCCTKCIRKYVLVTGRELGVSITKGNQIEVTVVPLSGRNLLIVLPNF